MFYDQEVSDLLEQTHRTAGPKGSSTHIRPPQTKKCRLPYHNRSNGRGTKSPYRAPSLLSM